MGIVAIMVALIFVASFYSASRKLTEQEGLPAGVTIDGMDVGGLSEEKARAALQEAFSARMAQVQIQVECEGKTVLFTPDDAGAKLLPDHALREAAALREGELIQQVDNILDAKQGWTAHSQVLFDKEKLRKAVDAFAATISYAETDATVQFTTTGEFYFTEEADGLAVDTDALCDLLYTHFAEEDYSDVSVEAYAIEPALTKEMLMQHTHKLGSYTTIVTGSAERVTNIHMITDTVNGLVIMPGKVLSLNELTGERTASKGYKEAPAIRYGELIEEIGGGICQLSGTLFNAALLSDMVIVERHNHTWPSDYLPVGLDATITWPGKDLKLQNASEWPMYIHATLVGSDLTVTMYGEYRNPELTVAVENDIYETTEAPDPVIVYDDTRPVGYRRTEQKARMGYRVRVYRHYYDGETLVNSELVHTDRYRAIAGKQVLGSMVEQIPIIPDEEK